MGKEVDGSLQTNQRMSFSSSSGDNAEARKPKPLGVDSKRLSTNEQARPIPYFAGKQRLAVTFISQVFVLRARVPMGRSTTGSRWVMLSSRLFKMS